MGFCFGQYSHCSRSCSSMNSFGYLGHSIGSTSSPFSLLALVCFIHTLHGTNHNSLQSSRKQLQTPQSTWRLQNNTSRQLPNLQQSLRLKKTAAANKALDPSGGSTLVNMGVSLARRSGQLGRWAASAQNRKLTTSPPRAPYVVPVRFRVPRPLANDSR
jgi:hypothetical protein